MLNTVFLKAYYLLLQQHDKIILFLLLLISFISFLLILSLLYEKNHDKTIKNKKHYE